jgi:dTDP-4-dehydrorhamnose reductase
MRILITGAKGQLGHDVLREAAGRGWEATGVDIDDFDLTDGAAARAALEKAEPEVVVHCAAYTAVDKAESEPALARAVNEDGTRHIAEYCAAKNAWLIYISTDYVFDGLGTHARESDEPPAPLNVYGKTKLAGELAARALCGKCVVVRTSWVFGKHGNNFVKTMLRLGGERSEVRVVGDQVGAPAYTVDLARLLCDMAARPVAGVYHAANAGACSWAAFAAEIFAQAGLACRVIPIPSSEYPRDARRPMNSRLSPRALQEAGYAPLRPWEEALADMLASGALACKSEKSTRSGGLAHV